MMDHNSPTSVKVHKASMPISRTNGPGYERPERARTSHACEPCRERKTKCDGERPACRRCLHTGTNCHYGYGKGWRKRKTAEDLSATSKKLQRYESLLNEIAPMVGPDIRAKIDEVRSQESPVSGTPEANDSTASSSISSSLTPSLSHERERPASVTNARLPLTLPVPGHLAPAQSRPQQPTPFDRAPESTSPHLAHHLKRDTSLDEMVPSRLPSITPSGMLIENNGRGTSPTYPRIGAPSLSPTEHLNPPIGSLYGSGTSKNHADGCARFDSSSAIKLSEPRYLDRQHVALSTSLVA